MSDVIKRDDAINSVLRSLNKEEYRSAWESGAIKELKHTLEQLPSADRPQVNAELKADFLKRQYEAVLDENKRLKAETPQWIPCSERLPSEEERKEWIDNNLDGIGYLYPCLVTRYSSINPDRTKNNPYVAKHYFDGEDFVNCGEEVCSEYILAWMPLPKPWKGAETCKHENLTDGNACVTTFKADGYCKYGERKEDE